MKAVQIVARGAWEIIAAADAALETDHALAGSAWSIVEEDEALGLWRLDAWPADSAAARRIGAKLRAQGLRPQTKPLADADWLALSLSGLPPVREGRFFVFGAHDAGRVPGNAVALAIEAGAAFGAGHHPTTRLCLTALDRRLRRAPPPRRVLDIGTGTGVLAIAAARTGARLVVATDIDPIAIRIATANARANRARGRFLATGRPDRVAVRAGRPYDLVFANILAEPLVSLAPKVGPLVARGGQAVLSGLLRGQRRAVAAAWRRAGFRLSSVLVREAWAALVLERPGRLG